MKRSFSILFLLAILLTTSPVWAQDTHYWTNQYGTRSSLLSGALVGGVRDTSAGFYNPGALAFIDNESLSVSANAYKFSKSEYNNAAGHGYDLTSDDADVVPLLVSGVEMFEGLPNHVFGFSFLTRQSHSVKASARIDETRDVITNSYFDGSEEYIGQFAFEGNLDEYWGGLSWAYKFSDHFSLGFTNFLALRTQKSDELILSRAVNTTNASSAIVDNGNLVDYWNVRALWKIGAALDYKPVKLGLTITTPSVNLFGDGTVSRDWTISGIDLNNDGAPNTFVANDRQEDLDSEYKTPFSIAAGMEYEISDCTKFVASVEYFDDVSQHDVLEPEDRNFVRPAGLIPVSSADFLRVVNASDDVFNWAAGIEQKINEKYTGYLSFRTDNSYATNIDTEGLGLGVTPWDIYHITLGTSRRGENSELSVGFVYSFGEKDNISQVVNFNNASEQNLLFGDVESADADYQSFGILFGYTYYIS